MVTRGRCCPIIAMGQAETPGRFQNLKWALHSPPHTLTPRLFLKVLRVSFLGPWGLLQKTLEGPSPVSLFPEKAAVTWPGSHGQEGCTGLGVKRPHKFAPLLCSPCLRPGTVGWEEEDTPTGRSWMCLAQAEALAGGRSPPYVLQSCLLSTSKRECWLSFAKQNTQGALKR